MSNTTKCEQCPPKIFFMFKKGSRFCLWKHDGSIKVWRQGNTTQISAQIVSDLSVGVVSISQAKLVIIEGNLNAGRYRNEILGLMTIPYIQNLGLNTIHQDNNALPHTTSIITESLQNLGEKWMEWPAVFPDLNPTGHLWEQTASSICETNTVLVYLQQLLALPTILVLENL